MSKSIFYAKNTDELLYQLKTTMDLTVVGGCTAIPEIPEKMVSVRKIPELCKITRHERYIDIGPGATLSEILDLGERHLPRLLIDALLSVANPIIRNTATIGGNLCNPTCKMTLFAALLALDTKIEMKSQNESETVSIQNFKQVPKGFVITNIRVPLPEDDVSVFKRVGPAHEINENSASFAFIAATERNSIISVKLAFAGPFAFRATELENSLIGKKLPFTQKDLVLVENQVKEEFSKAATDIMMSDVMRQQFINLARYSFEQLM